MLQIKFKSVFLTCLIFLATLPLLEAKLFWFYYNPISRHIINVVPPISQPFTKPQRSDPRQTILDLLKIIDKSQQKSEHETIENQCARLFGSIYGTKEQRILCLKKLKAKKEMKKLSQKKPQLLIDLKDPFMDFTRAVGLNQKSERSDLKDRFSTDYIDIGDLRMKMKNRNMKAKRRNTNIIYRASDSSDTDSDESIEIQKQSYYKKPKRFQVIENILTKEKESDDDSDDSSVEYKKPYKKPNAKTYKKPYVMPHKNQYKEPKRPIVEPHKNPEDSDDSSDEEYEKPYKTPKKKPINKNPYKNPAKKKPVKKEYYLQGTRLLSPSSEEDARRRIQHFLPKRFHWEPEDIQNLGYYWFNGPQGRYPYFAVRP